MNDPVRKVLAIVGDPNAHRPLKSFLERAGIEFVGAPDGAAGLKAFYAERPDVVVLGLELPDAGGLAVLGTIRELSDIPVLVVVAGGGEEDRVRALRAGADDCVTKPTSEQEIFARVEAILRRARRSGGEVAPVLDDDFIRIDRARHRVEILGAEVELTPIEFRMLATFAENPGRALGHDQLLDMIWGDRIRDRDEVKLYVSYLRRKLGAAGIDPVETVRGVGYRYQPRQLGSNGGKPDGD